MTQKNEENKNNESFEKAFERLETILENMNSGNLSLDASLKLFEEANTLIGKCNQKLKSAEQKIEILLKGRQNELLLDEKEEPLKESFEAENKDLFASKP